MNRAVYSLDTLLNGITFRCTFAISKNTHTYVSEAHNSKSTIFYILTSSVFLRARFISSEVLDEDPHNFSEPYIATNQVISPELV